MSYTCLKITSVFHITLMKLMACRWGIQGKRIYEREVDESATERVRIKSVRGGRFA